MLAEIRARSATAGLPDIQVAALDALHLEVLARAAGARRAVEVGTLGGYSGVALLRGMGPDGQLDTIEMSPHHADVARESFRRAGVGDRVRASTWARPPTCCRARRRAAPFDLVFIDADKEGYPGLPRLGGRQPAPGRRRAARQRLPVRPPARTGHRRSRDADPRDAVRPRGARARRKVSRDRPARRAKAWPSASASTARRGPSP